MKTLDDVIRLTVPAGRGLIRAMARDIRRAIARSAGPSDPALLGTVREIVRSYVPGFAGAFSDGLLTAWVAAARVVAEVAQDEPRVIELANPREPVRWPRVEKAVKWLGERRIVERNDLTDIRQEAKREGAIVAHVAGEQIVERVRAAIVDAAENGTNLRKFVKENADLGVDERELEALYRTHHGLFWSAGQKAVLDNPLVGDEFPYVLYTATHDSRVEDTHLMMERLGLDGTAVYRRDDPVIQKFWPPWRWNCRCEVIPLSIEDAARYGVKEAKRWMRTGRPPEVPQFVKHPPFDLPPGWLAA